MKYLVVIEKTRTGFSAYSAHVPGCAATSRTRTRVASAMRKAIRFHLDGMREQGLRLPKPRSWSTIVEVPRDPRRPLR